jgi:hypothetical protein
MEDIRNLDWDNIVKTQGSKNDPDNPSQQWEEDIKYKGFEIFKNIKKPNTYEIRNGDFVKKINFYQCQSIYSNEGFIIFVGWDDHIWFNTSNRRINEYIFLEKIPDRLFNDRQIEGFLIDRIKKEDHEFDPNIDIFENYSEWYCISCLFRTSNNLKVPLIKKDGFAIIPPGPHNISRRNDWYPTKKYYEGIPVYHFKWNINCASFILKNLLSSKKSKESIAKDWQEEMEIFLKLLGRRLYTSAFYKFIKKGQLKKGSQLIDFGGYKFNLICDE